MRRLGPVPARILLRFLADHGFHRVSQRGSHVKLQNDEGRTVIVPVHAGRPIKVGLLRAVLRDAGIPPDEFRR